MPSHEINHSQKYYNFGGRMPPVSLDTSSIAIPPRQTRTYPKLITDTTLRDGAQDPCIALFPNEVKLEYFDLLHELDNGTGVIEAVEVFIYQKRDLWLLEKLLGRGYDYPKVTTWTRATPKDIRDLLRISGGRIKETGMLASCSDHHIFDKMGFRSKQEAMDKYLAPILAACENGIRPRVHLEDATRADVEGWVIPFVRRVMEETRGSARFRLCDTLGIGLPDPHADLPFGIPRLVSTIANACEVELEFHGHNDFGYVIANSMAALRYGCKRVNVTFAGFGERTGNAPLEQVLANYVREYGDPGFNLTTLQKIASLMGKKVTPISEKQPIIGSKIFTTQAGIHQTGMKRQGEAPGGLIYLPFNPGLLGCDEEEFNRIGSLSGIDGIAAILNRGRAKNGSGEPELTATSRVVKMVYDRVHDAYDGQYDPANDRFTGCRTTFFEEHELVSLADELQSDRESL